MTRASHTRLAEVVGVGSVALVEVAMAVSLAALIVRDTTPGALPRLMGALLIGSALTAALVGLRSSLPGTVSTVQDTPVVVIAAVAAPLVADVGAEHEAATLLVFVALSGLTTGIVILLIGALRMGDVVRYLPTPVIDGFRLGTGWLLIVGGLEVAAASSLSTDLVGEIAGWSVALGLAVAIGMAASDRLDLPPAALSAAIVGTGIVFVVVGAVASSLDELSADGWLLGPLDSDPRWRLLTGELGDVDWGAIAGQTPALAAVAFISITGLLLNISAIESELDRDADIDADLRATGVANLLGGFAGSSPSYIMFSGTMLAQRLGLRRRRTSALVGVVILAVFVGGASVAAYTPRFLAGGLLAGLGLGLMVGWLAAHPTRTLADAALSLLVAVVIAVVGVLEGVGLGVVLAAAIFVRRYSLLDPVGRIWHGTTSLSRIDRDAETARRLAERRDEVVIMELEGFLFFGSAARIRRRVRARLGDEVRHLVLDFGAVTGVDGSANAQLRQLALRLQRRGVVVWLSGPAAAGIGAGADHHQDLDHAVEAVERTLLHDADVALDTDDPLVRLLAGIEPRPLAAGDDLFLPGDVADGFVLVDTGRVSVWLERDEGEPVRVRQVGPGALLGELGFATGEARSARATADDDAMVRVVDASVIAAADGEFVAELNRLLLARVAARLATTNELIRNLSR